jgi:hypothetical protein
MKHGSSREEERRRYNRRAWQRVEIVSQDSSVVELDIATTGAHGRRDALTEE